MRTSLCLLLLAIGAMRLAAQPEQRRLYPPRTFPPDIISQEELPRDIVRVASTHVRVDFENDQTRVLRLTLGAGAVVMREYHFAGAQRQAQHSRLVVFEVHANVADVGDTEDVAR